MLNYYMPVRLITGERCVENNSALFAAYGKKCLLITGASSAKKSGALDDVLRALEKENIASVLFDRIGPNPLLSVCMEAGILAERENVDFVVGIGGGSALDAAKAVSVFAANPGLDEADFYAFRWPIDPLPILLVGTTSGTGSEVTKVSVLTDSKQRKHSIHQDKLYAAVSFGDPRYTMSLPKSVTLSTGIDVLAHCMESYYSKKANHISKAAAAKGIRILYAPLMAAEKGEELSLAQREQLYEASILGGLAICVTGTVFPHNVGYYLTENYKIPHGVACAVFLPELMEHVEKAEPELAASLYEESGCSKEALSELISASLPELGVRMTAEEIEAALPRWENNGSVKSTVGTVTADHIREMLQNKFVK